MSHIRTLVHAVPFSEVAPGTLFTPIVELNKFQGSTIFRKIEGEAFNALIENYEGEACNKGQERFDAWILIVPLI